MDQLESMEEAQLRSVPTAKLVRQALEEARLLAKAEVMHAKAELRGELKAAKASGIFLGAAGALGVCGLALLLVALALALPLPGAPGALLVGAGVFLVAAVLGFLGVRRLPKKPLARTQQRLREDLTLAKEHLV